MNTARRDTYEAVPYFDVFAVDNLVFLDDTYRKTCNIVFVFSVKSRHLRRFAADERAARLTAAFAYALYYVGYSLGYEFGLSDIVEEEQRFCTLAYYIVYAHSNRVYTDSIVLVEYESVLEFGTYAVGTGYETVAVFLISECVKAAEAAQISEHVVVVRLFDVLFH